MKKIIINSFYQIFLFILFLNFVIGNSNIEDQVKNAFHNFKITTTEEMEQIKNSLKQNEVIPEVIHAFNPTIELNVQYNDKTVEYGNELTASATSSAPSVTWEPESDSTLYTLVMNDPDAPSRDSPVMREWRHWVIVNIPGNDISKGECITEYNGPTPPKGTGLHRYVFILYKQETEKPKKFASLPTGRGRFNAEIWSKANKLEPVSANFFQCKRN